MRYLVLLLFVFSSFFSNAQDCPPGSVTITSQAEMNSFAATYPNCTQINGNFTLGGNQYSGSIYPNFPALKKITGSLQFYANSSLTGFHNLDTIGGDLAFQQYEFNFSPLYVDITGFNELKYIGGNFRLLGYERICVQDLSGLSQLNYIGGDFDFYWQYQGSGVGDGCLNGINNLNGLEQLKHVGGKLRIGQSDLLNLDFLTSLESVGGDMEIRVNDLESIEGLNHAIDIGGELIIENNPDLSECALQSVCNHINSGGTTTIADNMAGCDNLQQVEASCNVDCSGDLILTTQQEIDDFMIDYAGCFHIEGNLIINGITPNEISNLNGLSEVISISDTLFIIDNQMLTDISGLANINYSSLEHIQISGNSILSSCSIASVCRFIANSGTNSIYSNNEDCNSETEIRDNCVICPSSYLFLESQDEVDEYRILYPGCTDVPETIIVTGDDIDNLNGLIEIERMEKGLKIESCPALIDLSGLDNLESVLSLTIEYNYALSNIEALSNLTTIHSTFRLINDVPLTGLENLQHMGTLKMLGNSSVTDFTVLSSLDSLGNLDLYSNNNLVSMDGLQNLTHLQHVGISKHDNLISLEGLNNVVSVKNFVVGDNSALLSFEGLNSLTYVTNDMNIGDYGGGNYGAAFQTLSGLDNLTTIDGDLMVAGAAQLNNLQGLNSLTSIGERFILSGNSGLNNLSGLENLTTVGSHLIMKYNEVTSLEGLNNLETINGDLRIGEDATGPGEAGNALQDINALSSLTSINGRLYIIGNDNLTTINNSFQNLDYNTITALYIHYNNNLSVCNAQVICDYLNAGGNGSIFFNSLGCNSVQEVEAVCTPMCPEDVTLHTQQEIDDFGNTPSCATISGNLSIQAAAPGDITNLDGLSQITTIDGWLLVEGTSASNLNGLSNLSSVDNAIVIKNNPALTDVSGLGNMTTLPSNLSIDNNDALIDLSGLENISQIGESLLIFDNDVLQNLSGLEGVTNIGLQLYVSGNAVLTNFSGLENLTSIGTNIRLQNNASLNTLTALSNVNTLGGYIRLSGHNTLQSLGGLENIEPNSITDLILTNNPNLAVCNQASVCTYLENGGTANITNNASGCNTQAEVEAICNDPCLATPLMSVDNPSIPDGLYQAADEINSTGMIPNNGTVNFKAGEVILLDNGFSVAPNADFSAEIEDCDGN